MIEYLYTEGQKSCEKEPLKVRLDGKICGAIYKVDGGYQYCTNGIKHCGAIFPTVDEVQKSLQND